MVGLNCDLNENDKIFDKYEKVLNLDDEQIQLLVEKYGSFIDKSSNRFDFMNKVIEDYNYFKRNVSRQEKNESSFVLNHWSDYKSDIDNENIGDELLTQLIKLIILKILSNKTVINSIKSGANL